MFDANKIKDEVIEWIKNWFERNGKNSPAVIGISGGKDSTVAATLLVKALGKDRVIGVMMPNGVQTDLADSRRVCELLDIESCTCNIQDIVQEFKPFNPTCKVSKQAKENLPPRIRMTLLYYISQNLNGRVCNTCNLSEDYLGYSTRWGDECGDFAPLRGLTCTEVMKIGDALGLPHELVHKTPSDGLCGQTDEDRFGFSYKELDMMLRLTNPMFPDSYSLPNATAKAIKRWHESSEFKRRPIESFTPKFIAHPPYYRLGLIVGRFQPLHNGHTSMILRSMELCYKTLILVGSAQESGTYNNPFTYEQRRGMIMDDFQIQNDDRYIQIAPLADAGLGNNSRWGNFVLEKCKEICGESPDVFITGEETRRESWFAGGDIDVIVVKKTDHNNGAKTLSATAIRKKLYAGDCKSVKGKIPDSDWPYIEKSGIIGNPPKQKETKSI